MKKETKAVFPVYITPEQRAKLEELKAQHGESVAEHIRRAIDAYLLDK